MNARTEKLIQEYLPVLRTSKLFRGIRDSDIRSMLGCLNVSSALYGYAEAVLSPGNSAGMAGILLDGELKVRHPDYRGGILAETSLVPGELFGEKAACAGLGGTAGPAGIRSPQIVSASFAAAVLWMDAAGFAAVCPSACPYHIRLIRNLMKTVCLDELRDAERISHLSLKTTRDKLLSYLAAESERQGKKDFTISLNRQELADYLLVERTAMSAQLSKLKQEGLIDYDRNRFRLMQ